MAGQLNEKSGYDTARQIVAVLRGEGHQAYFAGGCVRDLLLGVAAKDFDVATSATPQQVMACFEKTFAVGAHFGVVLVCLNGADGEEIATEVATFRHDGAYSDGRRPDAVQFSLDPREDVLRRDFTINGMLMDPEIFGATGDAAAATLDYVGGRADLAAKIVRAIGEPGLRFDEDKLRMLRAVRFTARLGFEIEPETARAIKARAGEIDQVSCERIREELTRILTEGGAARGFELLYELGLLQQIMPEAVKMRGVAQPPEYHPEGDVWVHTMLLLEGLSHLPGGKKPSATLAWGALLHDIGKPATFRAPDPANPGDRIRFNGHVEVGVRIAEVILGRLRFSNEDTAQIVALVKNHMRFGDVKGMRESTLKRFLRLPQFDEHLALHWLDCSSCHNDLRLHDFAKERYEAEPEEQHRPKLLLTGKELIAAGYQPGPDFKQMLEAAEDAQLEGTVKTTEEAMAVVREQFGEPPIKAEAPQRKDMTEQFDVIVVGAGMAGLTAARALGEGGLRVLILEARDTVGGRIMTQRVAGEALELGAEFVHGRPPELWALIDEIGLETYERDGTQVGFEDGKLEDFSGEMDDVFTPLEDLEGWTEPDCSFAEYLDRKQIEPEDRQQIVGYVEGFNAADHHVISVASLGAQQKAEDATEGDRIFRVKAGYDRLPQHLAGRAAELGGSILLGHQVSEIQWSKGSAQVVTAQGTFATKRLIVTLPLGVLHRGSVKFSPPVTTITEAAAGMRMGQVCRFTLMFRRRFWEELDPQPAMRELSFLYTFGNMPPVWWTPHPEVSNSLSGWVGGPRSEALIGLSAEELKQVAAASLAKVMGLTTAAVLAEITGCYTHDWQADEFALGAYSYVAVDGLGAAAAMAHPLEDTLYFAGEHTDVTGHWGTVHAAMRSGLRAAEQILKSTD
jgi:poly(A) polymerase